MTKVDETAPESEYRFQAEAKQGLQPRRIDGRLHNHPTASPPGTSAPMVGITVLCVGLKALDSFRLKGLLIYDFRLLIVLGKEANRGVFCRLSLLLWAAKE